MEGADHLIVETVLAVIILARGLPGDGERLGPDLAGLHELAEDGGHAARVVIGFAEILARRLDVGKQRDLVPNGLPILDREFDAHVAGDGGDVRRAVGGSADRRVHDDCVLEGFARQDL